MKDQHKILTVPEVQTVLAELHEKPKKQWSSQTNLAVFRLFVGCGVRCKEAAGLNLSDFVFDGPFPRLTVRAEVTKGRQGKRKKRTIPLDWDRGTFDDLQEYAERRMEMGGEHFIGNGHRLTRSSLQRRFKTCLKVLGPQRQMELASHSGRRTFASMALSVGHSLPEVRDALGHSNIKVTSIYLYAIAEEGLPDLYS